MKSDVCNVSVKQQRKVSYAEGALLGVILLVATKFCTLPSVLAGAAGNKAVWATAILTAMEFVTVFFAVKTAKMGGLPALALPSGVRVAVNGFFTLFFALKLTAFAREISTYYALSLFENAPVLPIMILLLVASATLANKGFMAAGRMAEIFMWLFVFVFLFIVIFTRAEGDLFNALGMFNPDLAGLGKGVFWGLGWYGDAAVISFIDLSGETRFSPHTKGIHDQGKQSKAKRRIVVAAALFCFLTITVFYAVFTSVYGEAAKMTDYAFIKLSAFKANTDELGSADWPVIILWSIVTTLYVTLLMIAGRESIYGAINKPEPQKRTPFPYAVLGVAAVLFSMFFLEEEGDYQIIMTKAVNVFTIVASALTVGLGVFCIIKHKKEGGYEKQD